MHLLRGHPIIQKAQMGFEEKEGMHSAPHTFSQTIMACNTHP